MKKKTVKKKKSRPVRVRRPKAVCIKKKLRSSGKGNSFLAVEAVNIEPLAVETPDTIHQTRIRVIGIGGGGSSIISEIASKMKKASFVAANTDIQALKKLSKGVKVFSFGQELTQGLGTGMNSELGKTAALASKEKITKLLEGQDLCVLVACLGGGAGSGAVPVFAKISRELGNITYGILTLPFKFEGEKKMEIARDALDKLKPYLNAVTILPNEAIFDVVDKTAPLNVALSSINRSLTDSLSGLIETIYDPGLINIDFADMRTVFFGRGRLAYLNTVEASGPGRDEEAIKKLLNNQLYPYTVKGAKGILYNISGKALRLEEVSRISQAISESVNKDAKIIFGISQGGNSPEQLKITLLGTGCGARVLGPKPKSEVKKVPDKVNEKIMSFADDKEEADSQKPVETKPPAAKAKKKKPAKVLAKHPLKKKAVSQVKPKKKTPKKKVKAKKKARPVKLGKEASKLGVLPEEVPAMAASFSSLGPEEMRTGVKVRRNALQVKKAAEEMEQEILNQEKKWEIPAFLRKHNNS